MSYNEKVKQRILDGDLSKPTELYPLLIDELARDKVEVVKFINIQMKLKNYVACSILDVGGANGRMVSGIDIPVKIVIDKRAFDQLPGVSYIHQEYGHDLSVADVTMFSEFLHLFSLENIEKFIKKCQSRYIIVVENKYDDFLDLRLRLWSGGACIPEGFLNELTGTKPYYVNGYGVWIFKNKNWSESNEIT
ncbi:MAG: hypothetical protein DRP85_03240 [Candidatus Makaraimicrobium thalassicum]|nr:MAG: hypothetical protein DRP85_03240 [Candidatus Omnitrophota bacterium]